MIQNVHWVSDFIVGQIRLPAQGTGYEDRRREWDEHAQESIKE